MSEAFGVALKQKMTRSCVSIDSGLISLLMSRMRREREAEIEEKEKEE
jgi:hypothetical protein